MIGRCGKGSLPALGVGIALLGTIVGTNAASTQTFEEFRERCRESAGKPIVQSCMKSGGGDLEACRAKASPAVKACVQKAMTAAHGRPNTPVAIPTEKSDPELALRAPAAGFVAPPRTISDITAILDSEKPDPGRINELKAKADAPPPTGGSRRDLAWFYYQRGNARANLGRLKDAIDDANKAMEVGRGAIDANMMGRLQQFAAIQYGFAGNLQRAVAIFKDQIRDTDTPGAKGYLFNSARNVAGFLIHMGDIEQADAYLRRSQALLQEARTSGMPLWRASYVSLGQSFEADHEDHRAIIFEARGQLREAEAAYRQAELRRRASVKGVLAFKNPPTESQILQHADALVLNQARMKARQGRFAEAEADARRALLARLKDTGKYHTLTPRFMIGLTNVLVEQGRYGDAETLARAAIEINREMGVAEDSHWAVNARVGLGNILTLQRKLPEAAAVYAEIDKAIVGWEPRRREALELNTMRILSLYASGQIEKGIATAQALLKQQASRQGEAHFDTAGTRGTLAIGYMRAGRPADAVREFKAALPVLAAAARENADDENASLVATRNLRLQSIAEAYIGLRRQEPHGIRR